MMLTQRARLHRDDPECWCHPEIVPSGRVDGILVARLVHNDRIGAHLGTWANTRLWDATWEAGRT